MSLRNFSRRESNFYKNRPSEILMVAFRIEIPQARRGFVKSGLDDAIELFIDKLKMVSRDRIFYLVSRLPDHCLNIFQLDPYYWRDIAIVFTGFVK